MSCRINEETTDINSESMSYMQIQIKTVDRGTKSREIFGNPISDLARCHINHYTFTRDLIPISVCLSLPLWLTMQEFIVALLAYLLPFKDKKSNLVLVLVLRREKNASAADICGSFILRTNG